MGLIIIEKIYNPSYEFLLWLYENRVGNELVLPSIQDNIEEPFLTSFSDCMEKGELTFCYWLFITFKAYIHNYQYSYVYSMCLIEHIQFLESRMTSDRFDMIGLSKQVSVRNDAKFGNVVRYAEWLISNGNLLIIQAEVILSFVEYFLFTTKQSPKDTIKRILYVCMFTTPSTQVAITKKLFSLVLDYYMIYPDGITLLVQTMGEVGLLCTVAGRTLLLDNSFENMEYGFRTPGLPQDLASKMWSASSGAIPLDQDDSAMRLAVDLLSEQYFTDVERSNSVFHRLISLDKDTRGAISQYGMVFLRVLLNMKYNDISHSHVEKMIFYGCFLPSINTMSPSQLENVTRLVLYKGNKQLLVNFDKKIRKFEIQSGTYFSIANEMIFGCHEETRLERIRDIVVLLDTDIDFSMMGKEDFWRILRIQDISQSVLGSIKKKNVTNLAALADKCLSECFRLGTVLKDYRHFIGPRTLEMILHTYDIAVDDCVIEQVHQYVKANFRKYMEILFSEVTDTDTFTALLNIPTAISGCIHIAPEMLIVGSQIYSIDDDGILCSFTPQTNNYCQTCGKTFDDKVFHNSEDQHGVYKCKECSSCETRASCSICMTVDGISIITCGHSYCRECLTRLTMQDHPACPMCRQHIDTKKVEYNHTDIIDKLLRELESSPEDTKGAAESLRETYYLKGEESEDDFVPEIEEEDAIRVFA